MVLFCGLNPAPNPSLGQNEFRPLDLGLDSFSLAECCEEVGVGIKEEGYGNGDRNGDSGEEDGLQ